jgi:NADH-quinone oxidoreductase subunit G
MQKGRPVDLDSAIATSRRLIDGAKRRVALVSSWGSNEELHAFKLELGLSFASYVKQDWMPQPGEPLQDDLLIRADKNPNRATALDLFLKADDGAQPLPRDVDLVLIWGEGFDFARVPPGAKTILLGSYLQPENGHADVFIPISIQTERRGHYTNFKGHVSAFEPCFAKKNGIADAEELFVSIAAMEKATA